MKTYEIIAEHGPVAADCIRFTVVAESKAAAKQEAVRYIRLHYDHLWDRIGQHNIYVYE